MKKLTLTIVCALVALPLLAWITDPQDTHKTGLLNIEGGVLIDGTEVTATADELNITDGMTATATELNAVADVSGYGTASNNATATETYGVVNKTVLALDDVSVVVVGATGVGFGGSASLYTFPEGRINVLGFMVDGLVVTPGTGLDAADGGDFAFGTVVVSDADLTDATDVDLCPSTSVDPLSGTNNAALAASAQFDGTSTAKSVFLNMLIDDADISATVTNTVDATVTIHWINLGDY